MNKDTNNKFILNKKKTEQIPQKDYDFLINNPVLMFIKNELNEKQEINKENEPNQAELEENEENEENSEVSMESNEQSINGETKYRRGRWTEEEHRNFLKGIIKYGNDWKMVEKIVKTRTSSQSRSHAQKYFLKFKNLVEYYNLNEKSLYEFITGDFSLSFFFDKQFIQLSLEEKKKLVNTFITNIDLFSKSKNKRRKKSIDKNKNIPTDDCNKIFKIESKDDNKSFHSDEDEDNENDNISSLNDKNVLNNKTKRNKIFNVVKCTKYKYSEEYMKNLDNKINKNIKLKFLVQKNKSEKNSNNKGNNNKGNSKMNNNYIINNNIININNTNNLDLNVLNIFNYNINTININNINYINNNNNESNKNIFENSEKNIIDNNNNFLSFSQKYLSYDFLRNSNNNNLNIFENDEEDELSSLSNNKNKTIFVSPL